MKQKIYVFTLRQSLFNAGIVLLVGLLIFRSKAVIQSVQEGLLLCGRTVIPALFPFLVLSGMLLSGGFTELLARVLSPVMRPLFRVNGAGALAFIVGIVSGYPTGAAVTAELYRTGKITKPEAERLLPFCNNSGPLFIIGGVGTAMLGNVRLGLFLYMVHMASAVLVGLCFRFYQINTPLPVYSSRQNPSCKSAESGFSAAVQKGVHTMLLICGYILLFGAISACIAPFIEGHLPSGVSLFLKGLLEVSGGCRMATESGFSLELVLIFISFFMGFGGICVLMQTAGLLAGTGIGLKTYFLGKTMQGFFAAILVRLFYPHVKPMTVTAFAPFVKTAVPPTWFGLLSFFLFVCFFLAAASRLIKKI